MSVKVGDRIFFDKWSGRCALRARISLIMKESDVLGVIQGDRVDQKAA